MSIPTGLFIDSPEVPDISMNPLTEDIDAWPEEIIQKVKERIPKSDGLSMYVKFMKKNDEMGAATGSIVIANAKKKAIVPVVIKEFMMYPLDIFIVNNRILPLTPDMFNEAFQSNEIFKTVEEYPVFGGLGRFEDANLWNATYPPSLGRYAYASAGYPILDAISDTVDASEFKLFLQKNAAVAAQFHKNNQSEIIQKVANLKPVNMNEFRQGADKLVQKTITMLRRQGPNKYTILSNSDKVFSPALTDLNKMQLCTTDLLSEVSDNVEDDINDVDQNGEKLLMVPKVLDDSHVYIEGLSGNADVVEACNEFDSYAVKSKSGVIHEGFVIPKVIDFDQNMMDFKMFIGKTMSTIQPEISGVRIQNTRMKMLKGEELRVGQTGAFVFQPNPSKALATVPVTLKSVSYMYGDATVVAVDLLGRTIKIQMSTCNLERIALVEDTYKIPSEKFKWVPMEGFEQVTNSAIDYLAKSAAQLKTTNPTILIPTGYGQYAMKGVDKYAHAVNWDPTNLEGYQVKFLLTSLGMGQEKQASVLKYAGRVGRAVIHGLNYVPLKSEKIAKATPLAESMKKIANKIKVNLIKEASYFDNSQTVDSLLSLNFVNPENISKFVSKIPTFKATVSHLAGCLLASRIGIQEIPEQPTSSAMYKLLDVINGLEALKAKQEIPQE